MMVIGNSRSCSDSPVATSVRRLSRSSNCCVEGDRSILKYMMLGRSGWAFMMVGERRPRSLTIFSVVKVEAVAVSTKAGVLKHKASRS